MKKKAIIFIVLAPFLYLYGLSENHFSFGMSIRGYTLEFTYEYINAWKVLFGREYKDNSLKISLYEYILKVKKAKFDLDIALLMKELYGKYGIRFSKKEKGKLDYYRNSDYGSLHLKIKQFGKDEFKLEYYNDSGWNKKRSLDTDYIFTKDEVIAMVRLIKEKD